LCTLQETNFSISSLGRFFFSLSSFLLRPTPEHPQVPVFSRPPSTIDAGRDRLFIQPFCETGTLGLDKFHGQLFCPFPDPCSFCKETSMDPSSLPPNLLFWPGRVLSPRKGLLGPPSGSRFFHPYLPMRPPGNVAQARHFILSDSPPFTHECGIYALILFLPPRFSSQ